MEGWMCTSRLVLVVLAFAVLVLSGCATGASSSAHHKRRGYGGRQGTSSPAEESSSPEGAPGEGGGAKGSPDAGVSSAPSSALGNLIPVADEKPSHRHHQRHHYSNGQHQKPEVTALPDHVFLSENCTLVMAQTGSTPMMHCEVGDIGEGTVSWIRRKDYHLLTVGLAPYSSDDRFFTAHVRHVQDWALHIRHAQVKDAGLYECQVSTHPPTSLFVELQLVEAQAEILGGPDKHVKSGSALRLTCLLRRSTEPPVYVFWYRDDRMINYDANAGVLVRHGRHSSDLEIRSAKPVDSGNYSCVPSNAKPASIHVHILNGEKPAAMQHGSKGSAASAGQGQQLQRAAAWIPALLLALFPLILFPMPLSVTHRFCRRDAGSIRVQCRS